MSECVCVDMHESIGVAESRTYEENTYRCHPWLVCSCTCEGAHSVGAVLKSSCKNSQNQNIYTKTKSLGQPTIVYFILVKRLIHALLTQVACLHFQPSCWIDQILSLIIHTHHITLF